MILACNASSILSHLSCLLSELKAHPLLFTLSANSPAASLPTRHRALLPLYIEGNATPFWSDIPGRPESQVGRWHAMRKKGKMWIRRVFGAGALLVTCCIAEGTQASFSVDSLRDGATAHTHIRRLREILRCRWSRSGPLTQTVSPGLHAITTPLKVAQSEGTLIDELDNANPTALLVSAIEKNALAGRAVKDDEFDLGLWQLHHIMAGRPSPGRMALDTETTPGEGTSVQLFHRPMNRDIVPAAGVLPKNTLVFVASPQVDDAVAQEGGDDDVTVLEDTFLAASEKD
ncbi:hypothetical protein V8E53_014222 [Lactarius tabidus]